MPASGPGRHRTIDYALPVLRSFRRKAVLYINSFQNSLPMHCPLPRKPCLPLSS